MIRDEAGREYLSSDEACKELQMGRSAFYAFVKRTSIPRYAKGRGRNRYFLREDIDAWAKKLDTIVPVDRKDDQA